MIRYSMTVADHRNAGNVIYAERGDAASLSDAQSRVGAALRRTVPMLSLQPSSVSSSTQVWQGEFIITAYVEEFRERV